MHWLWNISFFFLCRLQSSNMATKILYALSLLTACAVMITPLTQSTTHITPQVVHQKLEDALLADRTILYLMQKVFFPLQGLPPNLVEISVCVTVGSGLLENCDENSFFSGASNFSYWHCQSFQWSSSALVFLISFAKWTCTSGTKLGFTHPEDLTLNTSYES